MLALLTVLALSPPPLTLVGIQASQRVQAIEGRLRQYGWVGDGKEFRGRYQGLRAMLRLTCSTTRCKVQETPQHIVLTVYGATCKEGLAAVMRENGRPQDAYLGIGQEADESLWKRKSAKLTAYCVEDVVFARLSKN